MCDIPGLLGSLLSGCSEPNQVACGVCLGSAWLFCMSTGPWRHLELSLVASLHFPEHSLGGQLGAKQRQAPRQSGEKRQRLLGPFSGCFPVLGSSVEATLGESFAWDFTDVSSRDSPATLADLDTALSARGAGVLAETGWPGPCSLGVVSWWGTQAHGPAGEGQRVEVFLFCVCSLPEIRNFSLEKCSQEVQSSLHLLLFKTSLSCV